MSKIDAHDRSGLLSQPNLDAVSDMHRYFVILNQSQLWVDIIYPVETLGESGNNERVLGKRH